jgi:hypothetical protein
MRVSRCLLPSPWIESLWVVVAINKVIEEVVIYVSFFLDKLENSANKCANIMELGQIIFFDRTWANYLDFASVNFNFHVFVGASIPHVCKSGKYHSAEALPIFVLRVRYQRFLGVILGGINSIIN